MRPLEPLVRYRLFLKARGLWTEDWEGQLTEEAEARIDQAVAGAEAQPAPGPESVFDFMFDQLPPHLARQRAELVDLLKEG